MAVSSSASRLRTEAFASRPLVFQRGGGRDRVRRMSRRSSLGVRHVLLMFFGAAAIFYGVRQAALFLLTWDRLTVREVALLCDRPNLRRRIEGWLAVQPLGNILLCDLGRLRDGILAVPWVKEVRILKSYPSTLRIEIADRTPFAVLRAGEPALIDRDGVVLETVPSPDWAGLPVLEDADGFRSRRADRLHLAAMALDALPAAMRARLAALDLGGRDQVGLIFSDDPTRVLLSGTRLREGLGLYLERGPDWADRFGALACADLRFAGRAILRPLPPGAQPAKETE